MTYNSLVNQILDYLNRTDADTTSEIPNFIYQAEQRICRESKNIGLEQYVQGAFTVGVNVMAKPGRWRRSIAFNFGSGTGNNTVNQITLRSYDFVRNYWPDATQMGPPKFYSEYGFEHFLVLPTPDQAYPFEFSYLELLEPLSPSVQTNWLTNYAPDVLLYASLLEATPFLKNTELIPTWERLYERGLASLNVQDDQRYVDRATNRSAD